MKCIDCKHLRMVGAQPDQPYGEVYCSKGQFDGIGDMADLYEDHPITNECPDYQRLESVTGKNFYVSEEAVEHLIQELTRYGND